MNLNRPSKQLTGYYTGFCMDESYSGFLNLTGYLKSGLPLNNYYKNIYNQFGRYANQMADYSNIYFGKLGSEETGVLISQIYGAGGNLGAIYNADYIELYNQGPNVVDINGWSLQYSSAVSENWFRHTLNGSIQGKSYLLVAEAFGPHGTLLSPNLSGGLFLSATSGKIALRSNSSILSGSQPFSTGAVGIVDFVGYGPTGVSDHKGNYPVPSIPNSQLAMFRKLNGSYNTNDNSGDFYFGYPTPRNSSNNFQGVTLLNNSNNLNKVIISGAGLNTSTGEYTSNTIFSGKFKYIKDLGDQQIFWSGSRWFLTDIYDPLNNAYAYYSDDDTKYPWQARWQIYTDESFQYFNF
jgi:hypothetical protein